MTGGGIKAYRHLEALFARVGALEGTLEVLGWDSNVMMPSGGAETRGEQIAAVELAAHEALTGREVSDLLDAADADASLSRDQRANLREMRRSWVHAAATPADLVEALAKARAACEMSWRMARPANDFKAVLPGLEALVGLTREEAAAKSARLKVSPYDALLDAYEPGGRSAHIDRHFERLAGFLPGFIAEAIERQKTLPPAVQPEGPFPIDAQRRLGVALMTRLGFDFDHGRLDVSAHPFCGGVSDDVRITTRYNEQDFIQAMMGVLHETGHALYERGLPAAWRGQPAGAPRGMSLHESQSLLIEMQVARSAAFFEFAAPLIRETLGVKGPAYEPGNLRRLVTTVKRSLIRVEADEATYPAHVILRYRLERAMVAGDLKPRDLPGAWADGMQTLLGVVPPDDRLGCLQDPHWYDADFGYFLTYTLGAMTAAQLYAAAKDADPAIETGIARGDFGPLYAWLRPNVHSKGSLLETPAILIGATGRPLDSSVYEGHLRRRYLGR